MRDVVGMWIDGKSVSALSGATILEAAELAGVEIPTLCYQKDLLPDGSCRFCTVEIQSGKGTRLGSACAERVVPGIQVLTRSPKVVETRRMILALLLEKHQKSCFSCEKAQDCIDRKRPFCNYDNNCFSCPKTDECKLRAYCIEYGVISGACGSLRQEKPVNNSNPAFLYDTGRCILCRRCVRICKHILGDRRMIAVDGRGSSARVVLRLRPEIDCKTCMKCVALCPTGALVRKECDAK